MILFDLGKQLRPGQTVLAFGAHCDDIALGCGGLLRRLADPALRLKIRMIVFSGGADLTRAAEERRAAAALGASAVEIHDLPDMRLPDHWWEVKDHMWKVRDDIGVDDVGIVLAPGLGDRHQDHRIVAENAWRIFRDHLILEYEIAKYEPQSGERNFFVRLSTEEAEAKADMLVTSYPSRQIHDWWDRELFLASMRVHGIRCNARHAEAFLARTVAW